MKNSIETSIKHQKLKITVTPAIDTIHEQNTTPIYYNLECTSESKVEKE